MEKYLNKCVESIVNQTYKDLEIILVDDGSPDNCPQMCDDWAKKDSRIIVIHKPNGGVSSARNAGLDIAKGKYVGFVDPDDFIEPQMFNLMVKKIESDNSDLAICGFTKVSSDYVELLDKEYLVDTSVSVKQCIKEMFDINGLSLRPSVCNKLFKFNKVEKIRFDNNISISEDLKFCIEYLIESDKVSYVREPLYNNVCRNGSITRGAAKASAIRKTVEIDENLYRIVKTKYSDILDVVCEWTFQDNMGWYGELKKTCMKNEIKAMKKDILKRRFEIIFNSRIYWKEKIVIFFGLF